MLEQKAFGIKVLVQVDSIHVLESNSVGHISKIICRLEKNCEFFATTADESGRNFPVCPC